jgi:hypothetical protein
MPWLSEDAAMNRTNTAPAILEDYSLMAGLAATGMLLVTGLIYLSAALGRVDLLLL